MKRIILSMICVCFASMTLQAQNAGNARKVLDKTAAIISNKGGASANFKLTSQKNSTNGKITIKGNKFHATTPDGIVWYNGKTQWTYMKANEEVNVNTPTEAQQAQMNPYQFINLYKKGYALGMKTISGNYQVHLTATDKKRSIQELYITINSKTYLPSQVKMLQNGKWTTITISNFKTLNVSDAVFTFNSKDFPEAEVIDLR